MRDFYIFLANLFLLVLVLYIGEADESPSPDQVYIVYMGGNNAASGSHHLQLMTDLHIRKKNSVVQIFNKSFYGFAARLSEEEAKSIERTPGVVSVYPDRAIKLHTTHSWDFLMSQSAEFPMINKSNIHPNWRSTSPCESAWPCRGHDTIIGILDTGIWPEHSSFNDKCMDPIPSARWKGTCMADVNSAPFPCNKKLIGARYYDNPENPGYITSALDGVDHGTHVALIAAGVPVPGATYNYSLAKGTARGGSPCSRIAVYRVCGDDGMCLYSSVIKAFDDAIADGVDVISISIGWPFDGFFDEGVSIGAFHAAEKGIAVVASSGNDGHSPGTVENVGPWMMTVGASTTDRDIQATVVLGNNKNIRAKAIISPSLSNSAIYGLVDGYSARSHPGDATNSTNCNPGSLDGSKVKDKIVLCEYSDRVTLLDHKIDSLTKQGAIGIILIDNVLCTYMYDFGTTAIAPITEEDGAQIQSYIKTTRHPVATILPTRAIMNYKPAPVVASFSSRGPINGLTRLIKPDVLAPGVDILGAMWSPDHENRIDAFIFKSGTSMSCPHVSGLAAVVKSWHPTWSASAIRSAIMTTAIHTNNLKTQITTDNGSRATAYDMGAGEISLLGPLSPGLIYETEAIDYLQFLCNMGYNTSVIESIASTLPPNFDCPSNSSPDLISDMNYPSIAVFGLKENNAKTVKRTVTNVCEQYSTYTATVDAPAGLQVQVVPNKLQFTKNIKKLSFVVRFTLTTTPKENMFGSITWSNWKHNVRRSQFVANNIS